MSNPRNASGDWKFDDVVVVPEVVVAVVVLENTAPTLK
jgi:hypothetical protein